MNVSMLQVGDNKSAELLPEKTFWGSQAGLSISLMPDSRILLLTSKF